MTEIETIHLNPATAPEASTSEAPTSAPAPENASTGQPEASNAPVQATPAEDPRFAKKFAALTKKERELFKKEQSIKEHQAQVEAYQKAQQAAKANPLAYLKESGLSMEDVVNFALNQGEEPSKEQVLQQKVDTIQETLAKLEAAEQEKELAKAQEIQTQTVNQVMSAIEQVVTQNSDQYELINSYGKQEDVYQLMIGAFDQSDGEIRLTIQEAAQLVEEQLLKDAQIEAERLAKLKKLSGSKAISTEGKKLNPPVNEKQASKPTEEKTINTLTNQLATITPESQQPLTREESLALAAKKLVWK